MINKLCIYCEYFNIRASTEDYSGVTMREEEEISCYKNHFATMYGTAIEDLNQFRINVEKGLTCKDFEDFESID